MKIFESILLAELNLDLPPLTFFKIAEEPSDWTFILQLHAVLECALSRLLEKRMPEDLETTSSFVSKLQLAFELPELVHDDHYRSFLIALNFLRNRFAHRASYIVSDLRTVLQEIPAHRRDAVLLSLAVGVKIPDTQEDDPRNRPERRKFILDMPRFTIAMSAAYALDMLSLVYFVHLGKDGKWYAEEFRAQLQDLLHDPRVLEFRRTFDREFPDDLSSGSGG
jgi:hypothetical protein